MPHERRRSREDHAASSRNVGSVLFAFIRAQAKESDSPPKKAAEKKMKIFLAALAFSLSTVPMTTTTSNLFSETQLATLRTEYAGIGRIDPSSASYAKLLTLLKVLPQSALKQLAAAKIRFVSSLALNRVK